MQSDFNPYAAPTSTTMHPRAAEWLRSTDDPSLQKVARGLGLIYSGIIMIVLAIIVGLLLTVIMGIAAGGGGAILALTIAGLLALAGIIMIVVGTLMCLATPEETGARGLIIASVVLSIIGFCLSITTLFVQDQTFNAIGTLVSLASQITFLLFLKQLSAFIGAVPLAQRAQLLLTLLVVTVGLQLVTIVAAFVAPPLVFLTGLAVLVIAVVSFFLYLGLLDRLRKAIQSGGALYV